MEQQSPRAAPAIVILGNGSLASARKIQQLYPAATIYGLAERVQGADRSYHEFGTTLRELYRSGTPIIAICAAGIVIRSLASLLQEKGLEPPVLAVAEDGSAVVPLLGGLGGVNDMARQIAQVFAVSAAITTTGELRFGTCLLNPPAGYALADVEQGKRFVADLLGGASVRVEGEAPWLAPVPLRLEDDARLRICISHAVRVPSRDELVIHPRSVLVRVDLIDADLTQRILSALRNAELALPSLAAIVASRSAMTDAVLQHTANELHVPLRFVAVGEVGLQPSELAGSSQVDGLRLLVATQPVAVQKIGQARGRVTVIGLGPGAEEHRTPAVSAALHSATDLLGYETYIRMAGPLRPEQVLHCTDNREEMQRARHAFTLAAQGRSAVVVSSGDPGVFAMAAAVLEALHESDDPDWHSVDLQILPGISASLATAAQAGAPLGHDFCVLSLSDNLKPWAVIEKRLALAAEADLAMAFYNPISKARPWQLGRALAIVRDYRSPKTPVVLGRDIGRPGQTLRTMTLNDLTPEQVDMRTLVLIGSSTTVTFEKIPGALWVYTPRWYGDGKPEQS